MEKLVAGLTVAVSRAKLAGAWDSVVPSFLPQTQSQRRQLAGHGHAQDGRIDSLLEAGVIIILKRSSLVDGGQGRRLENLFQLGPMVGLSPRGCKAWGRRTARPCTRRYSLLPR